MKVTMRRKTTWQGKLLNVGSKVDVDNETAARWGKLGIARLPQRASTPPKDPPTTPTEVNGNAGNSDVSDDSGG
ncbi:MAG: hypothetical protein LBN05_08980 [Oscillospiraceae bacterium]|jgi:hypothetical protein|nr:hypothetical protein [Oscillospiraceae bacterium]